MTFDALVTVILCKPELVSVIVKLTGAGGPALLPDCTHDGGVGGGVAGRTVIETATECGDPAALSSKIT